MQAGARAGSQAGAGPAGRPPAGPAGEIGAAVSAAGRDSPGGNTAGVILVTHCKLRLKSTVKLSGLNAHNTCEQIYKRDEGRLVSRFPKVCDKHIMSVVRTRIGVQKDLSVIFEGRLAHATGVEMASID
jgi:hypothetical protein